MMTSQGGFQVILVVVMATVSVHSQTAGDCSAASVRRCMSQQASFSPSLPTRWTDDDYSTFCRAAEVFKACVDELSCNTSDEQYVAYQRAVGVAIGNEYLCSAAARRVFLVSQGCFTARLHLSSSFCRRIAISPSYASLSSVDQCRAQRRYYRCVYAGLAGTCGEQVADAVIEFNTRKYTPPLVASINCNLTTAMENYTMAEPLNPQYNCNVRSFYKCRNLVEQSPNLTSDDIDQLCRQSSEFVSCLETLECPDDHSLYVDFQQLTGVRAAYEYMCSEDVKTVISDNKQCIARAVSRLTANAASFTNPDVVCRSYEDHLLTIYKLVKSACANSDQVASVVTKMFSRQLGPIVNTAYNCQITDGDTGCQLVDILRCMSKQAAFSPSAPRPWNDADYDAFCSETEPLRSCMNSLSCSQSQRLYVAYQRLVGISDADQHLCSDSARPVLQANQACFASKLQSVASNCRQSTLSNDASASAASHADQCKSESEHYKCVFEALTTQCNKATATAVVQFNIKKQQPQLAASINCQLDTSYLPEPQSSAVMPSAVATVQLLMTGVIVYFNLH